MEVLEKLERKQRNRLSTARENVVDDVVKPPRRLVGGQTGRVSYGVLDHGRVIARELEVLARELVDDRVQLDNGGVDAMGHEGGWRRADSQPAE